MLFDRFSGLQIKVLFLMGEMVHQDHLMVSSSCYYWYTNLKIQMEALTGRASWEAFRLFGAALWECQGGSIPLHATSLF